MPIAPARLCAHPGCSRLERHSHKSAYEERRGGSTARCYDAVWQKVRKRVLAEEPLCRYCDRAGRIVASTTVDHMMPLSRGGERLRRENLCGCCATCNYSKGDRTAEEFLNGYKKPNTVSL